MLADPIITVDSGSTPIASNDNWVAGTSTAAQIISASAQDGACPLPAGSKDAALLITLQPGAYTVQVTGADDATGAVLFEIYNLTRVADADAIDPLLVTFNRYMEDDSVALWISEACVPAGVPANSAWNTGYVTAIGRESSGSANACNTYDTNATNPSGFSDVADWGYAVTGTGVNYQLKGALTPFGCSRGVAQCSPQTFAKYHAAGTSLNIYDPVANIAASINYVRDHYGVSVDGSDLASKVQQFDPSRPPKGYDVDQNQYD